MARVTIEAEHTAKRNEILDAAQHLINTKGYERMTIQDMLDNLGISKGAFYHYFRSKQAVLSALAERMGEQLGETLGPIAQDPQLSALEKLNHFFAKLGGWKTAQKSFLLALLPVWYTDDNAIVRQQIRAIMFSWATPILSQIIQQGQHEGILTTEHPDQVGRVALAVIDDLKDLLGALLLAHEPEAIKLPKAERIIATYTTALERVLGAPAASLTLVDAAMLKAWLGA